MHNPSYGNLQIPVLKNPSLLDITKKIEERKPFLVMDYDLGPCLEKWTPDYLSGKVGGVPVKIHVSTNPKMDFLKKNFRYKTLPFDELVNRASKSENENFFVDSKEFYYLRALGPDSRGKEVADFSRDFAAIAGDLKIPKVFSEKDFFSSIFRISSARVQLWTHYDVMDNILIQIRGKKKIVLWPPYELDKLYLIGDKSRVIDIEDPDPQLYPKFLNSIKYECELDEGSIIFIPALWFHNITAIQMSYGVNVFWKNLPHEFYEKKDVYGNKDLTVVTKALTSIENCIKSLNGLPKEYQNFYIKRMINQLESALQNFDE